MPSKFEVLSGDLPEVPDIVSSITVGDLLRNLDSAGSNSSITFGHAGNIDSIRYSLHDVRYQGNLILLIVIPTSLLGTAAMRVGHLFLTIRDKFSLSSIFDRSRSGPTDHRVICLVTDRRDENDHGTMHTTHWRPIVNIVPRIVGGSNPYTLVNLGESHPVEAVP